MSRPDRHDDLIELVNNTLDQAHAHDFPGGYPLAKAPNINGRQVKLRVVARYAEGRRYLCIDITYVECGIVIVLSDAQTAKPIGEPMLVASNGDITGAIHRVYTNFTQATIY